MNPSGNLPSKTDEILVDELTAEAVSKNLMQEGNQIDADAFIDSLLEEVYQQPSKSQTDSELPQQVNQAPVQQINASKLSERESLSGKYSPSGDSRTTEASHSTFKNSAQPIPKLYDPLELSPIAKLKQELLQSSPKQYSSDLDGEYEGGIDELLEFDLDRLIEELEFEQEDSTNHESAAGSVSSPSKEIPVEEISNTDEVNERSDHQDALGLNQPFSGSKIDLEFENIETPNQPQIPKSKKLEGFAKDPKSKGQLNESKKNQKFLDQYYKLSKAIETGDCGDAADKSHSKSKQKYPDHDPIPILDHRIPMQAQIDFEDYKIYFPYDPYPQQRDFITGLIKAIDKSEHMLIESPTGTGKTLCLLVGALAWQQKNIEQGKNKNAKIFYASRTHSQIGQLLRELKSTCYLPTVSILGSRDHLCVKEDLMNTNGHEKIQACYNHMKNRTCEYHVGYTGRRHDLPHEYKHKILDMEDWHQEARNCSFCPYYLSRSLIKHAHLVFLPYNYITTPDFRMLIREFMSNSIIILDEAHNMGKFAEDGASLTTSPDDLSKIIDEVVRTGDWLEQVAPGKGGDKCQSLLKLPMEKLRDFLLVRSKVPEFVGSTHPGEQLFETFRDILSHRNFVVYLLTLDQSFPKCG